MTEPASSRVVSVTGAAGSLGRVLVQRLLARGLTVKGLTRNDKGLPPGAVAVRGDLRDPGSLARLVEGAEVVFHLAAWISSPFDPKLAHEVNVEGTRHVIQAAARAGCRRVVVASSVAVYGPKLEGKLTEDSEPWSVGDPYSDSKTKAEEVAKQEAAAGGIELVMLRPTMIYGPASPPWTMEPFKLVAKGLPVIIGDGTDLLDAVYVDDVAHAFELAGFVPEARGEIFNIGGQTVTWNEFIGHYARMAGVKLKRLPAGLARGFTKVGAALSRLVGKQPRVIPEMVGVMTSKATFPYDKARRILGYEPRFSLEEGMRDTERWLKEAGMLKRPTVALVTGAASGLGRATALELNARGLTVWAADLRVEGMDALKQKGIHSLSMDVANEASVASAITEIERVTGPVDVAVNVAGILKPGPLEVQPMSELYAQLEVNALGPLRVARAVARSMRRRGWGRIVNVSSTNGFVSTPFFGSYAASKFALEALSDALRMELKPWGIDVAIVQPAAMKTGMADRARQAVLATYANESTGWKPYLDKFLNGGTWGDEGGDTPEKLARIVADSALAKSPRRRSRPMLAFAVKLSSILPAAVMDRILMGTVGLNEPPRELARGNVPALPASGGPVPPDTEQINRRVG